MQEDIKSIESEEFWKRHSEAWKVSGITQLAYSKQEGLNYGTFVYKHRKLNHPASSRGMQFIRASSEMMSASSQAVGLQLILPNGVRIGIANEVNIGFLQNVLTIAGALTC